MSSDSDEGDRGTLHNIIPKARRAIHDLPSFSRMYQPRDFNKSTEPSDSEEDFDEVDNILSKLVRPTSPIAAKRHLIRRSSANFEVVNDDTITEDILSKSSPAEFYIHSCNYRDENYQHGNSRHSNTSDSGIIFDNKLESCSQQLMKPSSKREKNSLNSMYILPFIIALVGICYFLYYNHNDSNIGSKIYDKLNFYNDVRNLSQKYKIKQDSMLQVRTGIDTIFKKEDTGSFVFIYDGKAVNFVHLNDFMDNIASAASKYLRNTKNIHHVVLDNNKVITIKSDAELIHEFRENVDKTGVLLVKNIETVPAKLAMAFHYYCDEYNPLVKKSAIFFTLDVTKCKMPLLSKASIDHDYVERCLKDKWKDVEVDKIGPLLTRVVTIIVDITNI